MQSFYWFWNYSWLRTEHADFQKFSAMFYQFWSDILWKNNWISEWRILCKMFKFKWNIVVIKYLLCWYQNLREISKSFRNFQEFLLENKSNINVSSYTVSHRSHQLLKINLNLLVISNFLTSWLRDQTHESLIELKKTEPNGCIC
jgi:hypothetical protein